MLSMKQCLVVPYIDPANQAHGVKTGHAMGINSSHKLIMIEIKKIFSEPCSQ